jgi:hypothetical protein
MDKKTTQSMQHELVASAQRIESAILVIRDQKVILDADLAELYGVSTKVFNQAVRRNQDRFPEDFKFRLTPVEKREVVTDCDHLRKLKYSSTLPYAFTEHGAIMAATVLNTPRAITISVYVVRAFVKLRGLVSSQTDFARKLENLEKRLEGHDEKFDVVFTAIRELMQPPIDSPKRRIGFSSSEEPQS